MRARRNPFARESYVPVKVPTNDPVLAQLRPITCSWCSQTAWPRHPLYQIRVESDGGRSNVIRGQFCSWADAEAYHDTRFDH